MKKENVFALVKQFIEDFKPTLLGILTKVIIPAAKKKLYTFADDYIDKCIEDLAKLADKYVSEQDAEKKELHAKGLRIGAEACKALAQKLMVACDTVLDVLE